MKELVFILITLSIDIFVSNVGHFFYFFWVPSFLFFFNFFLPSQRHNWPS